MCMVWAQMKRQQRVLVAHMSDWGKSGIVGMSQVDRKLGLAKYRGGLILNWWKEGSTLLMDRRHWFKGSGEICV